MFLPDGGGGGEEGKSKVRWFFAYGCFVRVERLIGRMHGGEGMC